ncbi:MAG TPA: LOG family protein [Candidatus Udaeobacter sp.]|nr:LOG family protein [Candidatus Udaeobacter sp.]
MSKPTPNFGQSDIVKLSEEDEAVALLERAVTGLWEVVNELTRLRRTTRQNYRVTIFGSARLQPGTLAYRQVKKLAAELTKMGCDIISGGGPGIMQAANEGALSVDPKALRRSVGIRVDLPFEQKLNPFVGLAYEHRTFFSRLHHFMIASDAFVVVPGGIGTLLELSLAWQLLQVRKLYNTPFILVGKMWAELVEWGRRTMLIEGSELASDVDFTIPHCVNTIDDTIALIRKNRIEWLAAQSAGRQQMSSQQTSC